MPNGLSDKLEFMIDVLKNTLFVLITLPTCHLKIRGVIPTASVTDTYDMVQGNHVFLIFGVCFIN